MREIFVEGGEMIGASIPRIDAIEKVLGKALYATDIKIQGMLYGKVLRSSLPHAKILNVDISRAQKLLGVKGVVTGKDLMGRYGTCIQDQPYYCFDKVRYVGDPVAGVAATDLDIAEEALELIKVDYEELPPVLDPVKGMEPDAPLIHEELGSYWCGPHYFPVPGTNICNHFKLRKGDLDEGFRQSDFISEDTFKTQMVQHCHLEPHAAIAQVSPSGQITIWTNTQHPYSCRRELARSLGMPMNQIRIIVTYVGGGFGGKVYLKVEPLSVVLAMKVKNSRPVQIVLTREEEFYATSIVRHPAVIQIKTGVKRDGTLMARRVKLVWDTGAYADAGPPISRNAGFSCNGPYKIPNLWVDSYCVYTNKTIAGAFRGFGIPQIMWAIDSQMDILAEGIGMDPVEIRLKNALEEGSISSTGEILHSVGIKECIQKSAEAIDWGKRSGENRGKGIGVMHKMTMAPSSSSAFVKLSDDGTAEVLTSTVDMGQGSSTIFAQIVAEELGLNVKDIKVASPDTSVTPFDHGTSSSRSTFHMGNAVKQAAVDAKRQLLEVAAEELEANPEDLEVRKGLIFVKGSPEKNIPLSKVSMGGSYLAIGKGKPIMGRGTFNVPDATPLDPETGQGAKPTVFWMYAAQAAEVEVDRETGKVKVLKIVSAHDIGKAINTSACEQQIEGAIATGVGTTLMEEIRIEGGKTLNPNFVDYKMPTSLDMPEMVPILVETIHESGPYGAKGLGEPALAPTAPAIANAIYDAVGVRIKELPITPDKVLKALKEKG
jgi:carbon-monoxide dehydrogenase large subunit